MFLSASNHLPFGLLLLCLSDASPTKHRLSKRETTDVLGGQNFPDPGICNVNGVSYVFGTTSAGMNIPMTSNSNFGNPSGWNQQLVDAFPTADVPAFSNWAVPTSSWAPDVHQLTDFDNSFAMYYAPALTSNSGVHCVGLARSLTVTGPYNDSSTAPMICPEDQGGAIDPSGFLDSDNSRYVVYKIDGPAANGGGYCANSANTNVKTPLMLQKTQSDGYTQIGDPVQLYDNDGESDSYNIEAPVITKGSDGTYYLFFSSGCYYDDSYAQWYVTSQSVTGPYGNRQALIQTGTFGTFGPGGASFDAASGDVVFHSLKTDNTVNDGRVLNTASYSMNGGSVSIN